MIGLYDLKCGDLLMCCGDIVLQFDSNKLVTLAHKNSIWIITNIENTFYFLSDFSEIKSSNCARLSVPFDVLETHFDIVTNEGASNDR